MLPQNIRQWMSCFANFMGTVVTITVFLPIFIVVIVPASIIFFFVQTVYVSTSRQLKRLESISRSPIYSHFSETLTGATTIRAFGMNQEFITESERKVDFNNVCCIALFMIPSFKCVMKVWITPNRVGNFQNMAKWKWPS